MRTFGWQGFENKLFDNVWVSAGGLQFVNFEGFKPLFLKKEILYQPECAELYPYKVEKGPVPMYLKLKLSRMNRAMSA